MSTANLQRFTGLADHYDACRPRPPAGLPDLLCQLAGVARPRLVVDLGSGTGLSTRIWAGRAEAVVGIEPNADMRRRAEAQPKAGVRYQPGRSTATGLPDGAADIVTCAQCLHWMDPELTFAEVTRILRPGGIFAAYDYDWPPACHWEVEEAFLAFRERVDALEAARGTPPGLHRWPKGEHLARMRASGRFRYTRELLMHHVETGDAARLIELATSGSGAGALLRAGASEAELGLDRLRATAECAFGNGALPWHFGYRIRIGVRIAATARHP
jgi:SAM-dependent methyltransferase